MLRQAAAVLTSAFVAWLLWCRLKAALRGGDAEKAAAEATKKKVSEAASRVQAVQRGHSGRKLSDAQRAAKEAAAKQADAKGGKQGGECMIS